MNILRLGIVPIDIELISKSFSSGEDFDYSKLRYEDLVEYAAKLGYKVIEITLDMLYLVPNILSDDVIQQLEKLRKKYDLSYTAHLPLWSIEPASPVPQIRQASVDALAEAFYQIESLKPEYYVLHATGALAAEFSRLNAPASLKSVIMQLFSGYAADSLEQFIDKTKIDPQRIAIEDIEFPWEYTRMLVDEFGTSICFDTGHLLAEYPGKIDFMEFIKMNGDKIREIHLHDGYRIIKNGQTVIADHIPLSKGKLPLKEFCDWLKKSDFNGPVILEQSFKYAKKSKMVLESICNLV